MCLKLDLMYKRVDRTLNKATRNKESRLIIQYLDMEDLKLIIIKNSRTF